MKKLSALVTQVSCLRSCLETQSCDRYIILRLLFNFHPINLMSEVHHRHRISKLPVGRGNCIPFSGKIENSAENNADDDAIDSFNPGNISQSWSIISWFRSICWTRVLLNIKDTYLQWHVIEVRPRLVVCPTQLICTWIFICVPWKS